MKTAVRSFVPCLALLLIVSLPALAASKDGIVTTKDGRQTIAAKPGPYTVPLQTDPASGLVKIYSNASKYPLGVYWCCAGWTISGSGSSNGTQYADAMPFTPSANATVKEIGVAVGYVSGTNEVTVSLNADSSGLPGSPLGSFTVSNLPIFGSCCSAEVESTSGISITKGKQYWVVVQTTTPDSDTWAAWNDNDTNETAQPFAYQNSGVWENVEGILGAFAVFGTQP